VFANARRASVIVKDKRHMMCKDCEVYQKNYYNTKKQLSKNFQIDKEVFKPHPIYTNYGASRDGQCVSYLTKHIIGRFSEQGYIRVSLYRSIEGQKKKYKKNMLLHRFVYECYNGEIPKDGKVHQCVMHINDIKHDNRIDNLKLGTISSNTLSAYQNGLGNKNRKKRSVEATNTRTNEVSKFKSMNSCAKSLSTNARSVLRCCDGIQQSVKSKVEPFDLYSVKFV
jgi:hypothetical protein